MEKQNADLMPGYNRFFCLAASEQQSIISESERAMRHVMKRTTRNPPGGNTAKEAITKHGYNNFRVHLRKVVTILMDILKCYLD